MNQLIDSAMCNAERTASGGRKSVGCKWSYRCMRGRKYANYTGSYKIPSGKWRDLRSGKAEMQAELLHLHWKCPRTVKD